MFISKTNILCNSIIALVIFSFSVHAQSEIDARQVWLKSLIKISDPVLQNLSNGKLREVMPVEQSPKRNRENVSHLEAFGRLIAGIAPWLELGADSSAEGKLRARYIKLSIRSIENAVDPTSSDFMNFTKEAQPLVDAAFLAHGLLRAPNQLWGNLNKTARENLTAALKSSRVIKPFNNNWLLFSAMVETALLEFTGDCNMEPINLALAKHDEWYKGDGVYGDGNEFHFDYYNSFVIQPMLLDIHKILVKHGLRKKTDYERILQRAKRYAEIQERLIAPDGSFPVVGRSVTYRFGAFQLLAQIALSHQLPEKLSPAQVRCALTAVIKRVMNCQHNFDENGWLTLGFCGHQPDLAETYISTGSLYLCSVVFLPLGLPSTDEFWSGPYEDWSSKRIWNGEDVEADKAYKEKRK